MDARTISPSIGRSPLSAALLAVVVLGTIVVVARLVAERVPLAALGARLEAGGAVALGAFLLLGVLATGAGLPRQALAFVAGLAYGTASGLALSLLAAIGGCALTVELSRTLLRERLARRHPRFVDALSRLLRRDAFWKIVALRLQPFGTNLATNLCAGLTPMPRRVFLAASLLGYVPQMLVFALIGSGVRVGSDARLAVSVVLLLVSLGLAALLYRRHLRASTAATEE